MTIVTVTVIVTGTEMIGIAASYLKLVMMSIWDVEFFHETTALVVVVPPGRCC